MNEKEKALADEYASKYESLLRSLKSMRMMNSNFGVSKDTFEPIDAGYHIADHQLPEARRLEEKLVAAPVSARQQMQKHLFGKIHDADSFEVNGVNSRLNDVNAPETMHDGKGVNQAFGPEAAEFVRSILQSPDRKPEWVAQGGKGKFGRPLGDVRYTDEAGVRKSLSEELLRRGYAWDMPGVPGRNPKNAAIQAEARAKKTGLWSDASAVNPSRFRSMPEATQRLFSDEARRNNAGGKFDPNNEDDVERMHRKLDEMVLPPDFLKQPFLQDQPLRDAPSPARQERTRRAMEKREARQDRLAGKINQTSVPFPDPGGSSFYDGFDHKQNSSNDAFGSANDALDGFSMAFVQLIIRMTQMVVKNRDAIETVLVKLDTEDENDEW